MAPFEQITAYLGIGGNINETLLLGALIVLRILPIVFQTPFLGGKLVPAQSRIGIGAMLTIIVWPTATGHMNGPLDINGPALIALMLKELFIGFTIGYVATELFYFMEVAGRAVDITRGSNMAEVQVPNLKLRASPVGQFSFQLLLVVFCAVNGHGHFIESVAESFQLVPVDGWPNIGGGFEELVDRILLYVSGLFGIAFAIVFPGVFSAFMVDVVFGMFNRIAPQLNAYFMAMGVKAMAGLAMFMFAMGLMIRELTFRLESSLLFVRNVIRFLD